MANSPLLRSVDALTAASIRPEHSHNPIIYWHLLSLDAPTVAMLWTWFIAESNGVKLPLTSILAMGVAVWILYATDRLLDARSTMDAQLERRHLFHQNHRSAFHAGIALASLALVFLVSCISPAALRLYVILAAPLIGYFVLIHLRRKSSKARSTPRLPKEIAVGIFFSAATFIPSVARNPVLRRPLLPAAALFGLACCLNCLFIYAWEHPFATSVPYPEAHPATRLALRFRAFLSILGIAGGFGLALYSSFSRGPNSAPWQLEVAISLSAALLLQLHFRRRHLDPAALRAAADLCLLTPILLVFTLHS
ncbi:hypothetical protein HDF16_003729 [Granulicella aggregans]|uniref:4-hydroxybenzoate polyprenyltransferase n=1 Tax=Granulicella aggregans TaxID=474949 RepID=A0A7W7ZGU3_9BACT|nr:hypothetical protein [Granulicella aggregans]MBB5059006.1 hypothetical protein [Granulicella aggregans]